MNKTQARKIASQTVVWYFNNVKREVPGLPIDKVSQRAPRFSNEMWARLMTEAILSFHKGLEEQVGTDGHRVANLTPEKLFKIAVDAVGQDAFETMAYLVAAAGTKIAIDEVDQAFQTAQQPQQPAPQPGVRGPEDLSTLLETQQDAQVYGKASTIIMQVESAAPSQGVYHQSAQQLQQFAKTPGLSKPFATALSSMGAQYMQLADQLTRESAQGATPGTTGPGISGLPTGVHIGWRQKVIAIRKRAVAEAKKLVA